MKIVFCSVNISWSHSCLALYYLRNVVLEYDYECEIIELTLKHSIWEAMETIASTNPDILCFSVYIWNALFLQHLLPELKKIMPSVKIILGGPEISHCNDAFSHYKPDYLVQGVGENCFKTLAQNNFGQEEKILQGIPIDFTQTRFPYRPEDRELLKGKIIYYEASRGCPLHCIYCLSSLDKEWVRLPIDRVFQDINLLVTYQPKVIKFVDRTFNFEKDWARAIWDHIINLDIKIPFHFEIHPGLLDEQDIELLSKANDNKIQFEAGIQSVNDKTLKLIKRFGTWDKAKNNLLKLHYLTHVKVHTDLIVGLPEETISDVIFSINEVLKTLPNEIQLGFLKILPATAMETYAQKNKYNWMNIPPYQIISTPYLSFSELIHLEKIATILNNYWNKSDFITVWEKVITIQNPYESLKELLQIHQELNINLHSIDKLKRFEIMSIWVEKYCRGEDKTYLQDALRWDWCRKASEPWYPSFLKGELALTFRKKHYSEIHNWLDNEYYANEDWNTKRFTIFKATSSQFAEKYLNGYTIAIFVCREAEENAVVIYSKVF